MDDLPDLQSDADVDALMGRLQAKLAPVSRASVSLAPEAGAAPVPAAAGAFADLVAAQEELASTMVRAMDVIAEALEELHGDATGHSVRPASPNQVSRRPVARVRATPPPSRRRGSKTR